MNRKRHARKAQRQRVLSIDPHIDRLGISWFDAGKMLDAKMKPIEYGAVKAHGHQHLVAIIMRFVEACEPDILLLPEMRSAGVRNRSEYVREAVDAVARAAYEQGISVHTIGHRQVLAALAGEGRSTLRNRQELHEEIIKRFPELTTFVPRARRLWDGEQYFTPMFHAVAMYCAWRRMT